MTKLHIREQLTDMRSKHQKDMLGTIPKVIHFVEST